MQVPNGTGPGARRSKRPLLACFTRCRYSNYGIFQELGKKIKLEKGYFFNPSCRYY